MIRRIINIDVEKCNGCGACALACHEGAAGQRKSISLEVVILSIRGDVQ